MEGHGATGVHYMQWTCQSYILTLDHGGMFFATIRPKGGVAKDVNKKNLNV